MALEPTASPGPALDAARFARRFDDALGRAYAYVAARVDDRAAAEEVTAVAFRRAIEATRAEGLDERDFDAVVYRVAATAVVDHARRAQGVSPSGARASDDRRVASGRGAGSRADALATRAFAAAIDRRSLRDAIQRLPDAQQRVIVVRYLDGLPIEEQCAALGWSRATLDRRVRAVLTSLRAVLAKETLDAA